MGATHIEIISWGRTGPFT